MPTFDFDRALYDFSSPLQMARLQKTVLDFMDLIRADDDSLDDAVVEKFCKFIDSESVWHLVQTVVPEFRSALADQDQSGRLQGRVRTVVAYFDRLEPPCLPPVNHQNILTSEQELLRQRHLNWIRYIETGGSAPRTEEEETAVQALMEKSENAVAALRDLGKEQEEDD